MGEEQKGVLIRSVQPISFAHGHLLPGDVLMAFDGVEVACGEQRRGWGLGGGLADCTALAPGFKQRRWFGTHVCTLGWQQVRPAWTVTKCSPRGMSLGTSPPMTHASVHPQTALCPSLVGQGTTPFYSKPIALHVCLCSPADGTVPFLSGERIAFSYLTSQKFTGEMATLDILRDGQPMRLEIKVGQAGLGEQEGSKSSIARQGLETLTNDAPPPHAWQWTVSLAQLSMHVLAALPSQPPWGPYSCTLAARLAATPHCPSVPQSCLR